MDATTLLITAALPVLELALFGLVGVALAYKEILTPSNCKIVAQLCYNCYVPAVVGSTLAAAMSFDAIAHLWPLLMNMTVSIMLGFLIGVITMRIVGAPHQFKAICIAAVAFGNVGNLPLVFVTPLCGQDTIFYFSLGEDCKVKGIGYVSFDMMIATLFQFSIAVHLLRPPDQQPRLFRKFPSASDLYASIKKKRPSNESNEDLISVEMNKLLDPLQQVQTLTEWPDGPDHVKFINSNELGLKKPLSELTSMETCARQTKNIPNTETSAFAMTWSDYFPPPTMAALAGLLVGFIPAVKSFFFGPLQPLTNVASTLGDALVPLAIPLLGAVIYRGPGKSKLPCRVIFGILITRLIVQPAILTLLVWSCLRLDIFPRMDAMAVLTLLLSNAMPTAINLQTLTVLYDHGAVEMSAILFWQYLLALLTLPCWMLVFLKIIDWYV